MTSWQQRLNMRVKVVIPGNDTKSVLLMIEYRDDTCKLVQFFIQNSQSYICVCLAYCRPVNHELWLSQS